MLSLADRYRAAEIGRDVKRRCIYVRWPTAFVFHDTVAGWCYVGGPTLQIGP